MPIGVRRAGRRRPPVLAGLAVGLLLTAAALQPTPQSAAQAAPYCPPGQRPVFAFGFAALKEQVGDVMGDPTSCEYGDPNGSGDTLQDTTTGLSFYRARSNMPTFTNGFEHWGLTPDGLVYWLGESIDPPGTDAGPASTPVPTPAASPTPRPTPRATPAPVRYRAVQQPGWPTPLEVPEGFTVEEVASGLPTPRFMALDADGSVVYGSLFDGVVGRLRDLDRDGRYETNQVVLSGRPYVHSVAFVQGQLYAAWEEQVLRLGDFAADGRARHVEEVIGGLPEGSRNLYGHRTRTILPGPDGKLYLSVGSSCDSCVETSPLRAVVLRSNLDGSSLEVFATGLRNTVGLAFRPGTNELWGVDMGRNDAGLTLPPEELNLLLPGRDYGWPYCYGAGIPSHDFGSPERCATTEHPRLTFPAHTAPLGIVFYDAPAGFPAAYRGDALIAFHGSAPDQTQDVRVGYNVLRVHFENGQPVGHEELLRGFASEGWHWGRPAGLLVLPDGSLLVSDDFGGRIFRLRYVG